MPEAELNRTGSASATSRRYGGCSRRTRRPGCCSRALAASRPWAGGCRGRPRGRRTAVRRGGRLRSWRMGHRAPARASRCGAGRLAAVPLIAPAGVRSVEPDQPASPPQHQVQNRDVAEADQRLGIAPGGSEVKATGDAVRALSSRRGQDRADTTIPKGVIDVGDSILVSSSEVVTEPVERVATNLDGQAPARQDLRTTHNVFALGGARRRYEPHGIARLQPRRNRHGELSCRWHDGVH